jgi:hypothetical protein
MIKFRNILLIILIVIFYALLSMIYIEISEQSFPILLNFLFGITLGLYITLKDSFEEGND